MTDRRVNRRYKNFRVNGKLQVHIIYYSEDSCQLLNASIFNGEKFGYSRQLLIYTVCIEDFYIVFAENAHDNYVHFCYASAPMETWEMLINFRQMS